MKQTILRFFISGLMICAMIFPTLPIQAQMTLDGSGSVSVNAVDPVIIGSISDDDTTALDGANSIYVSGKYAYVTSNDGVEIIDISDPAYPEHVGAILKADDATLNGASSIFISGQYAYVTTSTFSGIEGVVILDISDPATPSHVAAISDGDTLLDGAQSIHVSGRYAYIASFYDKAVEILDISDPASPTHVAAISGGDTALDGAKSIYVSGKYAYVASSIDNGVEIIDVSDPAEPTHVAAIDDSSGALLGGACSIYISGRYAYVAANSSKAIVVIDISDPKTPIHVSSITTHNAPNSLYISGRYAYVTSAAGVEIMDVSDPENLTQAGSVSMLGTSIYVSGKYAYVASTSANYGVKILDISGIAAPAASIGSIAASTLEVSENAQVGNNLQVNSSLNVGPGGIKSDGPVSITRNGADDDTNAILKLCRTNTDPASTFSQGMFFYGDSIETENVDMFINHYSSGDLSMCAGDGTSGGGGDVSIGSSSFMPSTRLFVNGNTLVNGNLRAMDTGAGGDILADGHIFAGGTVYADAFVEDSDARLKTNIRPIDSALDKVNRLQGVYFDWLDSKKYDDRRHVGVIAQETEMIFPEVVFTADDEMQTRSVSYGSLVAPLIEAVKELSATVENLRDENAELRTRIENLESKN